MSISVGDSIRVLWERNARLLDNDGMYADHPNHENPWLVGDVSYTQLGFLATFGIHLPDTTYGPTSHRAIMDTPWTSYFEVVTAATDLTANETFEARYGTILEIDYEVEGNVEFGRDVDAVIEEINITEVGYDAVVTIAGPPASLGSAIEVTIPGCDTIHWRVSGFRYKEKRGVYRRTELGLVRDPAA